MNNQKTANVNGVIKLGDTKIAATGKIKRSQEQEELIVNRLMGLFIAATLLVVGFLLLKKNETLAYVKMLNTVLPFVQIGFGILTLAAVVYFIIKKVKHKDESTKTFSSPIILALSVFLFAISLLYRSFEINTHIIIVIVVTAFCFIYAFYPRSFFYLSLVAAIGGIGIYCARYGVPSLLSAKMAIVALFRVLSFALPVAVAILFFLARRGAGGKKTRGNKFPVLGDGYNNPVFIIGAALLLAGAVTVTFIPNLVFYTLVVYFGAYLVSAIICTVKMI
jgi:hypothetical protein